MSGADDLRLAIETATRIGGTSAVRAMRAVLTDPKHAAAILNLVGDVHKGRMIVDGSMRTGQVAFDDTEWGVPGYWVTPRGEAT